MVRGLTLSSPPRGEQKYSHLGQGTAAIRVAILDLQPRDEKSLRTQITISLLHHDRHVGGINKES